MRRCKSHAVLPTLYKCHVPAGLIFVYNRDCTSRPWFRKERKLNTAKWLPIASRLGLTLFNADICDSNTDISTDKYRYLYFYVIRDICN